jgi:UrcA family protein
MIARTFPAFAASALLLATPAIAQDDRMSVEVRTSDLNLASDQGQARLQRRIHHAARAICGERPRNLELRESHDDCRAEVLTDAAQKIAALKLRTGDRIQVARRTR